jgi:hypothetical protein
LPLNGALEVAMASPQIDYELSVKGYSNGRADFKFLVEDCRHRLGHRRKPVVAPSLNARHMQSPYPIL